MGAYARCLATEPWMLNMIEPDAKDGASVALLLHALKPGYAPAEGDRGDCYGEKVSISAEATQCLWPLALDCR